MTAVVTKDGVVHRASDGPEGATTHCGLTEQTFVVTEGSRRITCYECANTETCPNCGQKVWVEVLPGRARTVTRTQTHIVAGKICHAILNTKENR